MNRKTENTLVYISITMAIAFFFYYRTMNDRVDRWRDLYHKANFKLEYLQDSIPATDSALLKSILKDADEQYLEGQERSWESQDEH